MKQTSTTAGRAPHAPLQMTAFQQAMAAHLRADAPLFALIGVYFTTSLMLHLATGRMLQFHPLMYMKLWVGSTVTVLGAYVLIAHGPAAWRADPRQPMSALIARVRPRVTPRFMAGLVLFLSLAVFKGSFTTLKVLQNQMQPFWADTSLANLDAALHFGVDPWRLVQPLIGHELVTRAIQHAYLTGWTFSILIFVGLAAMWPKLAAIRMRFFITYFLCWIGLGNVLATAFMSCGPVYYGVVTGDVARFADQKAYLAFSRGLYNSSIDVQQALWWLQGHGQEHVGSGISAFPSLHVAMATLFALTAFHIDRRLGWAMSAFAVVIFFGSIHLGWHYAVDGYVSAVVVAALWFGTGRVLDRKKARPAP